MKAKEKLIHLYLQDHPKSASHTLIKNGEKAISSIMKDYDPSVSISTLNLIPVSMLADSLFTLEDNRVVILVNQMHFNLVAGVFRKWIMNGHKKRVDLLLTQIEKNVSKAVSKLIKFPENTVGSLMNPAPFSISKDLTIKELLTILNKEKCRYSRYIHVVNDKNQLIGVMPFKDAFYADKDLLVSQIMTTNINSFKSDYLIKLAAKDSIWSKWDSVPITNSRGELLGVIRYDIIEDKVSGKISDYNENNEELMKAGEAVGEVIQIGVNAVVSAFGLVGNKK